jgi:hypothetical protein
LEAAKTILGRVFVAEKDRLCPFALGDRWVHLAVERKDLWVVLFDQKPTEHIEGDILSWDRKAEVIIRVASVLQREGDKCLLNEAVTEGLNGVVGGSAVSCERW